MTRRSLLAGGAGALAGGLSRGRAGAARGARGRADPMRGPDGALRSGTAGGAHGRAGANADLRGRQCRGRARRAVQLRFRGAGRQLEPLGLGGRTGTARGAATSWAIGDRVDAAARRVQLRSARDAERACACTSWMCSGGRGRARRAPRPLARRRRRSPLATPTLAAGPVSRRSSPPHWAQGMSRRGVAPEYGAVRAGVRAPHGEPERLLAAARCRRCCGRSTSFHRYVERLERHRLQLRRRPLRAHLRGARGGDRRAGRGRAGGRLQPRLDGRRGARASFTERADLDAPRAAPLRARCWRGSSRCTACPPLGRVTVRVDPAGASYSSYPADARVSLPRIAGHRDARHAPTARATCSTASCPRIRRSVLQLAGRARAGDARARRATAAAPASPRGAAGDAAPDAAAARPGGRARVPRRHARSRARRSRCRRGASREGAKSCTEQTLAEAADGRQRRMVGARRRSPPAARRRHLAAGAVPRRARACRRRVSEPLRPPARGAASLRAQRRQSAPAPSAEQLRLARREPVLRARSARAAWAPRALAAHSWQASLSASSIQASGRVARVGVDRVELPVRVACGPARSARSAGTAAPRGSRAGGGGARWRAPPSRWPRRARSARQLEQVSGRGGRKEVGYAVDRVEGPGDRRAPSVGVAGRPRRTAR